MNPGPTGSSTTTISKAAAVNQPAANRSNEHSRASDSGRPVTVPSTVQASAAIS